MLYMVIKIKQYIQMSRKLSTIGEVIMKGLMISAAIDKMSF